MVIPDQPRLLIGDQWVDSSRKQPIRNPFDDSVIAQVPLGDDGLLDRAIEAAERAFEATRKQPAHRRAEILSTIAEKISQHKQELTDLIVAEAGKPVTLAEGEVERAVGTFTIAAAEARQSHGQTIVMDALPAGEGYAGIVRRFPRGVIYGITPFNFPLNLVAHKVAPCIATGNAMLLKPAPRTPLTALKLAELLLESGMTPGQVNVVTCTNEQAERLVSDERIRMISFTGSTSVGWRLKGLAGRKKVTLELGGNAGVIVHDDADLAAAVPAIAAGAFGYAGQSCISVQRVIVQTNIYESFRERFIAHVKEKIHAGDPRDRGTSVGPLIDEKSARRVQGWIDSAVSGGARALTGGKVAGRMLEATILENVDPAAQICTEEAFAPVAILQPYAQFDDALRIVNDSSYGLQAGVFTRDIARAFRAFEELEVGGVLINQVPTFRVEQMPYGGVKASGFGREGLQYAMEEMTEPRLLAIKL